jgi:hypothetical protein
VGAAAALRLAADGWEVTSSGRSAGRFPHELREAGVRFARSDRHAAGDLRELLHLGANAVIDCVGYIAPHARMLLPFRQGRRNVLIKTAGNIVNETGPDV